MPPAMAAERRDVRKAKYIFMLRLYMTRMFGSNLIGQVAAGLAANVSPSRAHASSETIFESALVTRAKKSQRFEKRGLLI